MEKRSQENLGVRKACAKTQRHERGDGLFGLKRRGVRQVGEGKGAMEVTEERKIAHSK